ncbi:hypothetical protein [Actinotalea solisilvae]|uniref:hypothetical protein n=1 Tax=Actinotalea solisilvae TaxID=2072922 RepID=UPI0018F188ED|nr:hypothetical protein [Actinotalea solisilvae]
MSTDDIAESIERVRYERLLGKAWDDLRESERETRLVAVRQAFEDVGLAARLESLTGRAAEADRLAAVVSQRDGEIARLRAEHDAELVRLTGAHTDAVAALEAELAETRAELALTQAALTDAERRAHASDAALSAVATVVGAARELAESSSDAGEREPCTPDELPVVTAVEGSGAPLPRPKGRLSRLVRLGSD